MQLDQRWRIITGIDIRCGRKKGFYSHDSTPDSNRAGRIMPCLASDYQMRFQQMPISDVFPS